MANTMPSYPRFLFSRLLDQIFVAGTQIEERQLLERHNWRPLPLYVPLPYPKRVKSLTTGETRVLDTKSEDECLSGIWIDLDSLPAPSRFPCVMLAKDGRVCTVENESEETQFLADGWVDGHTWWSAPANHGITLRELNSAQKLEYLAGRPTSNGKRNK